MTTTAPVTVLYTAWAPFFSGAERALLVLLDGLDRSRYRPVVAVGTHGELEREVQARGIPTRYIPVVYSGLTTIPRWLRSMQALIGFARQERAAILHANDVPSFQPAGYVARWLRRPAITHVRFPDTRQGFEWFLKSRFDVALFVSKALRDDSLGEAPRLFENRDDVIHDSVQPATVSTEEERRAIRTELGLPVDRLLIGISGQVAEIKGIWEFIDAAARLTSRGAPFAFVVVGDDLKGGGRLRLDAERAAAARGLGERMSFVGFRSDARRIISAMDLVAVPSHVEPLGLSVLEAMAAGVPVVGTRVGGIPEIIIDRQTGLLVPPRDGEALAEAIAWMMSDVTRARAFGRAGRERAQTVFGVETQARRVQDVYDRVLTRA